MKNTKILKLTQLSLLSAIILVMAYTPIGYLKTPGLEISFLMIPVTVGAIILGPKSGATLGLIFGLTSFGTCFTASTFGAALLSISPIKTFIVCVVSRVITGYLAGAIYKAIKNFKFSTAIASIISPLLNTALFMGSLVLFFYSSEFIQNFSQTIGATNPFNFILLFVGVQGLIEAIVCFLISSVVCNALKKIIK